MSPTVAKIIFIVAKVLLISFFLIKGISSHWSMPKRNYQVIALLLMYQFLLVLITIAELFFEYIPLIYMILVIASASQVYQVYLFIESCKEYLQAKVLLRNRIILAVYMVIYFFLSIATFIVGVAARCDTQGRISAFGPKTYPPCFILLMVTNLVFWVFTSVQIWKNYEIDQNLLGSKAEE